MKPRRAVSRITEVRDWLDHPADTYDPRRVTWVDVLACLAVTAALVAVLAAAVWLATAISDHLARTTLERITQP